MDYSIPHFISKLVIDLSEETVHEHIDLEFNKIKDSMKKHIQNCSRRLLENIENLELQIAAYKSLSPTSYLPLLKNKEI